MQYLPIRIDSIVPEMTLGFNVYMQVGNRHILYFNAEDAIEDHRLKSLLDKEVKVLYIDINDAQTYKKFLENLVAKKRENSEVFPATIQNSPQADDSIDSAIDDMHKAPREPVNYRAIVQSVEGVVQVISRRPETLGDYMQMFKEQGTNNPAYLHANRVCATTVALASLSGIKSPKLIHLGCAAMLLEIGVISLPSEYKALFMKNPDEMSKEELTIYQSIPQKSHDLLSDLKHVPKEVLSYIIMHEERKSGLGFPFGEKKIPKDHEILNICACFDRKTTFYGMSVSQAFQSMSIDELGNFDLALINKFKSLLKSQKTPLD